MRRVLLGPKRACPAPHSLPPKRVAMDQSIDSSQPPTHRAWTFNLRPPVLEQCEIPAISGDCIELGSWTSSAVRPLVPASTPGLWTTTIQLPIDKDVQFRYCVCVFPADSKRILVRSWETNIRPRTILKSSSQSESPDIYGEYDKVNKIDRGWLTTEALLQLKFHNNPFMFKSALKDGGLQIKLTPVNFEFNCDDFNPLTEESMNDGEAPKCTITQVATIDSTNYKFGHQLQFGREYKKNDFLIFNVVSDDLNNLAYLVDFYKLNASSDVLPQHLGCSYILPNTLKNTEGQIELPVTCNKKHRPLGSMSVEYLIVRAMPENLCDMSVSYTNHWNERWTGLDVGHRGSGSSFKAKLGVSIRENTIASLKKAAESGADMLEFDVQLSKDLVPVIYHDFHVSIALKPKNSSEHSEMLEIPMKDLTLEQLQKLKVYHVVEGRSNEPKFFDEDLAEHQPFPKLSEVLEAIDPLVGFNIEIKGTMPLENGTLELEHQFDLNLYLDKILEVVLKFGGKRRIVFSSFHPDICTMLNLKQNLYPTMFLTQGVTTRYPSYRDLRCNTIASAVYHALNSGLLGIVVHTEDLLRDPTQVKMVLDAGLIIFCWGEDNNNTDTIKYLKKLGLHGVIFDKLDQYSTKKVKESIFSVEAREAQNQILRIAAVEKKLNDD